ncbi:MAG TPA: ABC transporter permease, partial [Burkholderiaceae bacterium]|nr:ABC transporter permease [Burkholderiaceae bacterium]
ASHAPLWVPLSLLALGGLLLLLPPVAGLPLPAYLAIALWLLGGIALVPHGASLAGGLLRRDAVARAGPAAWLAAQRVAATPGGTSAALGGIVASVALAAAMAIMVTSFRSSVDSWLDTVLPADLYASVDGSAADAGFDAAAQQRIIATPGVERAEFLRSTRISLDASRPAVVVLARPIDANEPQRRLPITGRLLAAPAGTVPIWVSEAVADIYGWTPGRPVALPLERSPAADDRTAMSIAGKDAMFHVSGVWRDYGRQHGAIAIDLADWQRLTGDDRITDAALWLAGGAHAEGVAASLRATLAEHEQLRLRSAGAIREASLNIFDRSFAVTWALEAVAIVVALFGVASAWSTEAIARAREFGMLRHLGLSATAIVRQFAIEAAALVSVAVAWGLAIGAAIALVLVHRVNPQSFHWTMDTRWPLAELAAAGVALIVLAVIVATIAARQVSGMAPVRAVREDW